MCKVLVTTKSVRNYQKLSETVRKCSKLSKSFPNCQKLSEIVKTAGSCQTLPETVRNFQKLPDTHQNCKRPVRNSQNLSKAIKNFWGHLSSSYEQLWLTVLWLTSLKVFASQSIIGTLNPCLGCHCLHFNIERYRSSIHFKVFVYFKCKETIINKCNCH